MSKADAVAFKHACTVYVDLAIRQITRIHYLATIFSDQKINLYGIDENTSHWCNQYFGEIKNYEIKYVNKPSFIRNLFLSICIVTHSMIFVLQRIKFKKFNQQKYLLGVDFNGDERFRNLIDEVVDSPSDVLIVHRNRNLLALGKEFFPANTYRHISQDEGHIHWPFFISYTKDLISVSRKLFNITKGFPSCLAFEILKIPARQVIFKALFERFHLKYFLARDDYNFEHILRTNELRKNNCKSLGIAHGLPVPEAVCGTWRYIDFDIYYIFGNTISGILPPNMV